MPTLEFPEIILMGLDEHKVKILSTFLADTYRFIVINHDFSLNALSSYQNINLFIINMDQMWIRNKEFMKILKESDQYRNIPVLGMAKREEISNLTQKFKNYFEDFIPMPLNTEDLLTRIDAWVRTYKIVSADTDSTKKTCAVMTQELPTERVSFENFSL